MYDSAGSPDSYEELVEAICETDEVLMEKFFSDEDIPIKDLQKAAIASGDERLISMLATFCMPDELPDTE